jgi:arginyl-tRNA synthetase
MGLFDKIFGKKQINSKKIIDNNDKLKENPETVADVIASKIKKPTNKRKSKTQNQSKTAKEIATEKGEPYIAILNVELDSENIGAGAFELDWNDKFLAQLVRSGYQVRPNEPENEIVDRWFQDVCRNVVLETYEQLEANNPRTVVRKDIGNGRAEIG